MTKIITTSVSKEVFEELWDTENANKLTLNTLMKIANELYVINPKWNGFHKCSNECIKLKKNKVIEVIQMNLWYLKEMYKYVNKKLGETLNLDDLNAYSEYYSECAKLGVF